MILSHKQTDEVFTNTLRALDSSNAEHQDTIYEIFSSFTREPLTLTKEKGNLYFENKNIRFTFKSLDFERYKDVRVLVYEISKLGHEHTVLGLDISSHITLFDNKTVRELISN